MNTGTWAIIEVFGHQKHAGRVSEGTIAGAPVLVVEQPGHEREDIEREPYPGSRRRKVTTSYPTSTIELGGASIFRRTICTEEEANAAIRYCTQTRTPVVTVGEWEEPPARPALPGPVEDAEEVEGDDIPFDDDSDEAPSPEEQARRYALAEQPCPRGPCVECEGADPYGHHWDDASRDIDDARQECRHCDAERPYPDDEGDGEDELPEVEPILPGRGDRL